jgi:hypothetical protein
MAGLGRRGALESLVLISTVSNLDFTLCGVIGLAPSTRSLKDSERTNPIRNRTKLKKTNKKIELNNSYSYTDSSRARHLAASQQAQHQ